MKNHNSSSKKTLSFAAVSLLVVMTLVSAQAAVLVDVDFNTMTAGQPVVVSVPTGTNPATAATTYAAAGSTATIVSNFTSTASPFAPFNSGNNSLVLVKTSASSGTNLYFKANSSAAINTGIVSMTFNMMVDNGVSRGGNFFVYMVNDAGTPISYFTFSNATNPGLFFYNGTTNTQVSTLTTATSYAFEIQLNYATSQASAFLNGASVGTAGTFNSGLAVTGMLLSFGSTGRGEYAFANLDVQTIPEPSSVALLSLVIVPGAYALVRRRRQAKA